MTGAISRGATVSTLALAIAAMGHAAPAWAQDAATPAGEAAADLPATQAPRAEEIIVTGSRLGRTTFNSPTPVNVVGQQRVQDLNITNVGDALNQLPSFRPIASPAANQFRSSANIAGRSLDLRGLGAIRTLTLIDGRRHVTSSDDGTFDLNAIPSNLVQRSEVVTGGASAAYGAGAVSGVVNLILDTRFSGLKGEVNYGISQEGDARKFYAALQAGADFAGGRGHVLIGGEYADEGPVGDATTRDWGRKAHEFVPNPFWNANPALSNGLPANIGTDGTTSALNGAGVISVVSPFQGMQFDKTGNLVPFVFGSLYNVAKPSNLMIGGGSEYYNSLGSPYLVAVKHYAILGHVSYDLTSDITASAEVSYAKVTGGPTGSNPRSDANGALRVLRDNAFLNPIVAAKMDAARVTFLPISRINFELGANVYHSKNETWTGFAGLKGGLAGDWQWDGYYQYGRTKGIQQNDNSRLEQRFKDSIDAVRAPAGIPGIAPGTIICRTTIANPTNGCVPANIMGLDNISPAAARWANAVAFSTRKFTQNIIAGNLRGTVVQGWAGPIKAAVGAEYRTEASVGDNDAFSKQNLFSQLAWTVLPASTQKVTEAYLEVNVPILADSPIGKSLEVDGAVRRTHYNVSGSATTWKVGGVYQLTDEYMLRVTRSHDIRAPSPLELNPNQTTVTVSLADPKYNVNYFVPTYNGGNPKLNLETANTLTIGAVFQPHWFPKFKLSVDYYDIKVGGVIDIPSSVLAMSLCRTGTLPGICTLGPDANGNPDRVLALFTTYQNVNQLHARGLEIVANYTLELADIAQSAPGALNFAVNGNYVDELSTTLPNGTTRDVSNFTGNAGGVTAITGVPRWRADAIVTYALPTWSLTAHMSYTPSGIQNPDWIGPGQAGYSVSLPNSVNDNSVSSRFYLDLAARVKIAGGDDRKWELFGGINNVFDKDPPSQLRFNGNPLLFDPIGRSFRVGVRADW